MNDRPLDEEEPDRDDRPTWVRVAAGIGGIVLILLLVWAAAHVAVPPIYGHTPPPEGHYRAPCWTCHFVGEGERATEER